MTAIRVWLRKGWPLIAAVVVAVPVFVWAGMRVTADDPPPPGATAAEPGMSHVHGLGIDPTDGTLIAATHFGMFRVADGQATRIGTSFQDTMGFTVTESGRYLGSGHPDAAGFDAGQPSQLGLIESTDAGLTWTNLDMEGEADFHAMAASGGVLYAWDASSNRLFRTDGDGSLEERSTLPVLSLVADPDEPDVVVAAGPSGLQRSMDGGSSWQPWDGPDLASLSWQPGTALWGATAGGEVWRRGPEGSEGWRVQGQTPGEVHVLLAASDDSLYAAGIDDAGEATIWSSDDAGQTWAVYATGGGS
jgi:hypothetical protein